MLAGLNILVLRHYRFTNYLRPANNIIINNFFERKLLIRYSKRVMKSF